MQPEVPSTGAIDHSRGSGNVKPGDMTNVLRSKQIF